MLGAREKNNILMKTESGQLKLTLVILTKKA